MRVFQQFLILAILQHLAFCLKLVRIFHVDKQAGSIDQLPNKPEEDRMRCSCAKATKARACQRRIYGDESVLAHIKGDALPRDNVPVSSPPKFHRQ